LNDRGRRRWQKRVEILLDVKREGFGNLAHCVGFVGRRILAAANRRSV
jgi:hypothetical protein